MALDTDRCFMPGERGAHVTVGTLGDRVINSNWIRVNIWASWLRSCAWLGFHYRVVTIHPHRTLGRLWRNVLRDRLVACHKNCG